MSETNTRYPSGSPVDETSVADWRGAIGRTETISETLGSEPLRRFALAVGSDPTVEVTPPPLSHWAFFLPLVEDESIGHDGHPNRDGFLPNISLPRRMFAAATIEFLEPLVLEKNARLVSQIAGVNHKQGRSGDLVFVEVERTIEQNGKLSVREHQSFVYRGEGEAMTLPAPLPILPEGEVWLPQAVNLFRFSAATFNAHRIHYDSTYAQEMEGYPTLVVHGPFTATRLATLAMHHGPLARFSFRAFAPLFVGQPVYLRSSGDVVEATRCDGVVAMRAEFVLA